MSNNLYNKSPYNKCLVNVFSQGRENYESGTTRLIQSAINADFKGNILIFSPNILENRQFGLSTGFTLYKLKGWPNTQQYGQCLPHTQVPQMFKSYAIQYAKEQGYNQIMWCDSSVVILKNPEHYFKLAEDIGVVLFDADKAIEAEWTSDHILEQMGCSIEYARQINQCSAAVLVFDFKREFANMVFDDFIHFCSLPGIYKEGSIRPEYKANRHDQSIISYLIRKHGGYTLTYGGLMWGGEPKEKIEKYSPTFITRGM
jgi:hypothetical protein